MKQEETEITEEEYQEIKRQINDIILYKEQLKLAIEKQKYKSHIPLAENFGELLINLIRNNHEIDEEINLAIKQFLKTLPNNKIREEIKSIIYSQQTILIAKKKIDATKPPVEFISIAAHYPSFETVYTTLQDGINKKIANNYLMSQVETLQNRYELLNSQMLEYEKRKHKKVKKRRNKFIIGKKFKERNKIEENKK